MYGELYTGWGRAGRGHLELSFTPGKELQHCLKISDYQGLGRRVTGLSCPSPPQRDGADMVKGLKGQQGVTSGTQRAQAQLRINILDWRADGARDKRNI